MAEGSFFSVASLTSTLQMLVISVRLSFISIAPDSIDIEGELWRMHSANLKFQKECDDVVLATSRKRQTSSENLKLVVLVSFKTMTSFRFSFRLDGVIAFTVEFSLSTVAIGSFLRRLLAGVATRLSIVLPFISCRRLEQIRKVPQVH